MLLKLFTKLIFIWPMIWTEAALIPTGRVSPGLTPIQDLDVDYRFCKKCVVPANEDGTDDAPAVLEAFTKCGRNGHVVFQNTTYHINTFLNTTGLFNVKIDIYGTLLWSKNTTYWLQNSAPIGYQNQTAAWFLGGRFLQVRGYGYGTLDGNGQIWYDLVKGESNYPNRPHALALWYTEDSLIDNVRFVQAQMWTVDVLHSKRVILQDIYVNNTSNNSNPARNTDGANTIFSDNIVFRRWFVRNGDDCIALKANSTNILIEDMIFHDGEGIAIGSIGQYKNIYERIENVTARNVVCYGTKYAARIKTWTGDQVGYPPNGGGGGLGYARNIRYDNFTLYDLDSYPIVFSQCTTYNGVKGNCSSSLFKISDFAATNFVGSANTSYAAYLQCSRAAGGCDDINIEANITNLAVDPAAPATKYHCQDVHDVSGFSCS